MSFWEVPLSQLDEPEVLCAVNRPRACASVNGVLLETRMRTWYVMCLLFQLDYLLELLIYSTIT